MNGARGVLFARASRFVDRERLLGAWRGCADQSARTPLPAAANNSINRAAAGDSQLLSR